MFRFGNRIKAGIVTLVVAVGCGTGMPAMAADDVLVQDFSEAGPTLEALPTGWTLSGTNVAEYAAGSCAAEKLGGNASGVLQSTGYNFSGGGNLMRSIDASAYRGKHLRFAAYVKTEGVQSGAGLLVNVQGAQQSLRAVDSRRQPVMGTTGWKPCEVIVEVPLNAERISFGVWLDGRGRVFLNGLRLETVVSQDLAQAAPSLSFGS